MTVALAASSLVFAIPAAFAFYVYVDDAAAWWWIGAPVALLFLTSMVRHSTAVGLHPLVRGIDRAVAASVTIAYTGAAIRAGHAIPAACGAVAALMYGLSKVVSTRYNQPAHVVVHLAGALGLTLHIAMLHERMHAVAAWDELS